MTTDAVRRFIARFKLIFCVCFIRSYYIKNFQRRAIFIKESRAII